MACKDVDGLFKALNMSHCPDEWRLFIDSPKVSLQAVLLHNGIVLPSIPVAHAFGMKESDDSMKQLLQYSTSIYIRIGTFRFFKSQKVKFCISMLSEDFAKPYFHKY